MGQYGDVVISVAHHRHQVLLGSLLIGSAVISLLKSCRSNRVGSRGRISLGQSNDGHLCHLSNSVAVRLIVQFRHRIAVVLLCPFIINFMVKPRSISIIVQLIPICWFICLLIYFFFSIVAGSDQFTFQCFMLSTLKWFERPQFRLHPEFFFRLPGIAAALLSLIHSLYLSIFSFFLLSLLPFYFYLNSTTVLIIDSYTNAPLASFPSGRNLPAVCSNRPWRVMPS